MRVGQCGCGAVTIAADDVEPTVVACHCRDCQRRTGSPFGVSAYYPASAVAVSGSTRSYTRPTASGGAFTSHFCRECGSTAYWTVAKYPDMRGVPVGAFADPEFPAPSRSLWEQSRHHWADVTCAADHYLRGRDGPKTGSG